MQVAREVGLSAFCGEGEDCGGSIRIFVEFPGHAADGGVGGEPDHDFVGVVSAGAGGDKYIVGDVGYEVRAGAA